MASPKMCGVIPAERASARQRIRSDVRPGNLLLPIDAIGISRQGMHLRLGTERERQCQQKFDVAAAAAAAAHRDRGFAAG